MAAPLTGVEATVTHAPYAAGECALCHERNDPKNPGSAKTPVNKVCMECHEELQGLLTTSKSPHKAATDSCTSCHNPHNSSLEKLLTARVPALCTGCHASIAAEMASAVRHDAVSAGRSCLSCHGPHASNVEKLLLRKPYDLCVGCHSSDGMKDSSGKALMNFGKLLADNRVHHEPVAQKDCSSCHKPHGGSVTRLLASEYPSAFYAPFRPENYALCFTCHDEKMVTVAETATDTRFRDGSRNLHYLHVNKQDRGRICRACHEVHAARQAFLIRESVPYGSGGWMLKVGYTKNADGGTCDKTCHSAKSYVNVVKK